MQDAEKNILLVSYVFPPYYGIGGRRWAKHSIGLAKQGYTVHVICARNPYPVESLWYDQVKANPRIKIYAINAKYPFTLIKTNTNFISKIAYKIWINILPILTNRNFYDRSLFWNKAMLSKAKEIIKENKIDKLICSGGPFGSMFFVTTLKSEFKNLRVINDLRDPWTWAPNWGFPSLAKKRMQKEQQMEKEMVSNSDVVTVPTDGLLNVLKNKYPESKSKFIKLPHVFDESEIEVVPKSDSKTLRLVYYGSVYEGIEPVFDKILSKISDNKNVSIDIYSDGLTKLNSILIKNKSQNIKAYKSISPKALFSNFRNYDAVLMINPLYNVDNISTKFYEIIYSRTPIVLISEKGLGPDFIQANKLGLHILPGDVDTVFNNLNKQMLEFNYNSNFDVSEYSLKSVTKQICSILET